MSDDDVGDEIADDVEEDLAAECVSEGEEAWKEYKTSFDKRPDEDDDHHQGDDGDEDDDDDKPLSTTRVGGYVFGDGKPLGRIVACPVADDPRGQLVTVSCYLKAHGPGCCLDVRLEGGMTRASLVQWIRHSSAFKTKEAHVKALRAGKGFSMPAVVPSPEPAVPVPLPLPPRADPIERARGAVAPAGSRQVSHGGVAFSELWSAGRMTGVSLTCRHHGCVRDLAFGKRDPMSPEEGRRRLLAWEAAGLGKSEEQHVAMGQSKLLSRFASA